MGHENLHANLEVEIRFSADPAGLEVAARSDLLRAAAVEPAEELVSTYFDTPSHALRRDGVALRLRAQASGAALAQLKCAHGDGYDPFAQEELEAPAAADAPDLSAFPSDVAQRLAQTIGEEPLSPQFATFIQRSVRRLSRGGAEIEVAFDEGTIVAGGRSTPLRRLELELKSGPIAELYALACDLAQAAPLRLEATTKADLGFQLAEGTSARPAKADKLAFAQDATVDDVTALILGSALSQFFANMAPLRESDDPESIHQLRVALRRLRSALSLFGRALPSPEFHAFGAQAGKLASALGPARELDVLRDAIAQTREAEPNFFEEEFESLDELARARKLDLYARARACLDDATTTRAALLLRLHIAERRWRLGAGDLRQLSRPARDFAAAELDRLLRRVLKRGRGLASLPSHERHRTRVALKRLRYAAEAFAGFFPDGAARAYLALAADLQDRLGAHNDAAGLHHTLEGLEPLRRPQTALAAGLVLGWRSRDVTASETKLRKVWRKFRKQEPFWR